MVLGAGRLTERGGRPRAPHPPVPRRVRPHKRLRALQPVHQLLRRVVRHLYSRYGDDSFARSIAELDRDILADGDAPVAGEACEVSGRPPRGG